MNIVGQWTKCPASCQVKYLFFCRCYPLTSWKVPVYAIGRLLLSPNVPWALETLRILFLFCLYPPKAFVAAAKGGFCKWAQGFCQLTDHRADQHTDARLSVPMISRLEQCRGHAGSPSFLSAFEKTNRENKKTIRGDPKDQQKGYRPFPISVRGA